MKKTSKRHRCWGQKGPKVDEKTNMHFRLSWRTPVGKVRPEGLLTTIHHYIITALQHYNITALQNHSITRSTKDHSLQQWGTQRTTDYNITNMNPLPRLGPHKGVGRFAAMVVQNFGITCRTVSIEFTNYGPHWQCRFFVLRAALVV